MSHICVYLGKGGCLLKIPFRYLEIIGWSESFENPLMHTTLDRALLAPHSPLYRQPLVYIACKNESKLSTDVSMDKTKRYSFQLKSSNMMQIDQFLVQNQKFLQFS